MKIAHIIPTVEKGGAEFLILDLVKYFSKNHKEIEFEIVTILKKGALCDDFEKLGVKVECISNSGFGFFSSLLKLIIYLRKNKPDAVQTHLAMGNTIGLLASFFSGIKIRFSTLHDTIPAQNRYEKILFPLLPCLSKRIIAVSNSVKENWMRVLGINEKKFFVIHNGIKEFSLSSTAISPSRICNPHLISLGRIDPIKGYHYSIKAVEILKKELPEIKLEIFGPSYNNEYYEQLNEKILQSGLEKSVSLNKPIKITPEKLKNYAALLNSSLSEGFGLANLEAMACGLPILASDIPVHREIITEKAGIFFRPESAASIVTAIRTIFSEPKLRKLLSKNSLLISAGYSISNMSEKYYILYKKTKEDYQHANQSSIPN